MLVLLIKAFERVQHGKLNAIEVDDLDPRIMSNLYRNQSYKHGSRNVPRYFLSTEE